MDSRERSMMAGVTIKNRLKMFEGGASGASGASGGQANGCKANWTPKGNGTTTATATKPQIPKKSNFAGGNDGSSKPPVANKWLNTATKLGAKFDVNNLKQDHNQNKVSSESSTTPSIPAKPSAVTNAKGMFEKKDTNGDANSASKPIAIAKSALTSSLANKGSEPSPNKPFGAKPLMPPKVGAKPTQTAHFSEGVESPNLTNDKPGSRNLETKSGRALANFLQKQTDNLSSDKPSAISSSPSSLLSSSSSSVSSSSSSSLISKDTSGPHDFRSNLRPKAKPTTPPMPSTTTSTITSVPPPVPSGKPSSVPAATSSPTSPSSSTVTTTSSSSSVSASAGGSVFSHWKNQERRTSGPDFGQKGIKLPGLDKDSPLSPSGSDPVVLRTSQESQKRQISQGSAILCRSHDGKKFRKIKVDSLPSEAEGPPAKPALPPDVDLQAITDQYHKAILELKEESIGDDEEIEDDDDIYTDGTSEQNIFPRPPTFPRVSQRVSMIPEMTEEEEIGTDIYDDGLTPLPPAPTLAELDLGTQHPQAEDPDDVYEDGVSEKPQDWTEEDLYEDEESLAQKMEELERVTEETEQEKKKRLKREEEAKKKEALERKRKKKEEKERQMREKKQRKKFQLTGEEIDVGEGVISQDAKGKGDNLTVSEGQKVIIVRLDKNPSNKWLVRSGTQLGFVDSSIIDVNPSIIRQAMDRSKSVSSSQEGGCPTYDDVPEPVPVKPKEDEFEEMEDIYEAFD